MSGLAMMEGCVDAVVTYVSANVPAKIAALNMEFADSIQLPDITNVYSVEKLEIEPGDFPRVEVLGMRTDIQSENAAMVNSLSSLAIVCSIADDTDRANLRRRGYRYARAIVELLKAARSDGGLSGYAVGKIGPIDFGPLRWKRGESRVIADVIIGVQILTAEVFP